MSMIKQFNSIHYAPIGEEGAFALKHPQCTPVAKEVG